MYINFKWSDEQQFVIDKMIEFTINDEPILVLTGFAGTGKTSVMNEFVQYLDSKGISFILCAPTHKAKFVLEQATGGYETVTLHSLLSLSPTLDIFNLDYNDLKFKSGGLSAIPTDGIIIVDEASMISDDLYNLLVEYCDRCNCKILFVGDIAQLRPVNNDGLSKVFENSNIIRLTKIFRQDNDNALAPLLLRLRGSPINRFKDIQGKSGSLYTYNNAKDFIIRAIPEIKYAIKNKDINHIKIIAYTNKRVDALNACVRRILFKESKKPYHIGEILMGTENFEYNRNQFYNSSDYIITAIEYTKRRIPYFLELPGYELSLYDSSDKVLRNIFIIDTDKIGQDYLDSLAQTMENIRMDAILCKRSNRTKSKNLWSKYYDMQKSFASPIPLMFDNRVVKAKTFTYGYAISAHKSQGSSYDIIFVDIPNLLLNKDLMELRQLQYVALSRTKTDAHLLI